MNYNESLNYKEIIMFNKNQQNNKKNNQNQNNQNQNQQKKDN